MNKSAQSKSAKLTLLDLRSKADRKRLSKSLIEEIKASPIFQRQSVRSGTSASKNKKDSQDCDKWFVVDLACDGIGHLHCIIYDNACIIDRL